MIIAKLDRLARSVDLIAGILDSGLDFVALDAPHANKFTLHILAALAEYESELMSQRMKSIYAAAKGRGVDLASRKRPTPTYFPGSAYAASAKNRRDRSEVRANDLAPLIWAAIGVGKSLRVFADEFNRDGIVPPRTAPWSKNSIERLARRTRPEFGCAQSVQPEISLTFAQVRMRRQTAEIGPLLIDFWRAGKTYTDMRDELAPRGVASPWERAWGKGSLRRYLMRALRVPALRQAQRALV